MWCREGIPSRGTLTVLSRGTVNLAKFSKAESKVLHLDQGSPKHKYRLSRELVESSPEEKDVGDVDCQES